MLEPSILTMRSMRPRGATRDAALDEAAQKARKWLGEALAAARRHLRKAFFEIDARDARRSGISQ